jgi:hypothetical protein
LGIDHSHLLLAEQATKNSPVSLLERRFMDIELVRVGPTLNDALAEAIGAGDEDDVAEA